MVTFVGVLVAALTVPMAVTAAGLSMHTSTGTIVLTLVAALSVCAALAILVVLPEIVLLEIRAGNTPLSTRLPPPVALPVFFQPAITIVAGLLMTVTFQALGLGLGLAPDPRGTYPLVGAGVALIVAVGLGCWAGVRAARFIEHELSRSAELTRSGRLLPSGQLRALDERWDELLGRRRRWLESARIACLGNPGRGRPACGSMLHVASRRTAWGVTGRHLLAGLVASHVSIQLVLVLAANVHWYFGEPLLPAITTMLAVAEPGYLCASALLICLYPALRREQEEADHLHRAYAQWCAWQGGDVSPGHRQASPPTRLALLRRALDLRAENPWF